MYMEEWRDWVAFPKPPSAHMEEVGFGTGMLAFRPGALTSESFSRGKLILRITGVGDKVNVEVRDLAKGSRLEETEPGN